MTEYIKREARSALVNIFGLLQKPILPQLQLLRGK
jgi:hypothetical protein